MMSTMRPARVLELAALPATGLSAGAFAALSAIRGKRFFHPDGVSFEAAVTFDDSSPLPLRGEADALVRLSRGMGLPEGLPDVLGLAVKLPDLGQDFLFATSGDDAVSRHLLFPSSGFFRRSYSSVLPYECAGRTIVLGARADRSLVDLEGQQMGDVRRHVGTREVRFDLTWGPAGTGEVHAFASLRLEGPHIGALAFNPFNSVPGLRPAGALNRLRLETYRRSQEARPDSSATA